MENSNSKFDPQSVGMVTVVDEHPRFWCEFILWLLSANTHMNCPKRAYFIGNTPSALVDFAHRNGCDTRFFDRLIPQAPHCNKIIPFLDPDGFADQIVTDSDVFVTADISIFFKPNMVRLAPNNHAVPPLDLFERLFSSAGLDVLAEPGTALFSGLAGNRETYAKNVSAGVIAIPQSCREFAKAWKDRAIWLCDNIEMLGRYRGHIDQISFAMAAADYDLPFLHLPAQANAVLQLLPEIRNLFALHLTSAHIVKFPDWFNLDGTLRVEKINEFLSEPINNFNELVPKAMAEIDKIEQLKEFKPNFLNPNYRR